jgi:hypothetical protein
MRVTSGEDHGYSRLSIPIASSGRDASLGLIVDASSKAPRINGWRLAKSNEILFEHGSTK